MGIIKVIVSIMYLGYNLLLFSSLILLFSNVTKFNDTLSSALIAFVFFLSLLTPILLVIGVKKRNNFLILTTHSLFLLFDAVILIETYRFCQNIREFLFLIVLIVLYKPLVHFESNYI